MADWIKLRHSLLRSPKLRGLMRALKCNKHTALGLAVEWLCWIDEQTEDGETGLTPDELADELGFRGCANALCSIGWAALGEDGTVHALEFGKHCGDSAKKRAEEAMRKAQQRANVPKKAGQMSQKKRDKCPEKAGTETGTNVPQNVPKNEGPEKKRKEKNIKVGKVKGSSTHVGASPPSSPPPPGFAEWVQALCAVHPTLRDCRALAKDVEEAALDAFARCPSMAEHAELLGAFLADSLQEDRYRHRFWRPTGQAMFFDKLEDVLAHAKLWDRETGWSRKRSKPAKPQPVSPPAPADEQPPASEAETEAFRAMLRAGAEGKPLPTPPPDDALDVEHALRHLPGCTLPADQVPACADAFFREGSTSGFSADWRAALRTFAQQFAP